jgi:hypothetical protein
MDSIPKFDIVYFLLELGADPYLAAPNGGVIFNRFRICKKNDTDKKARAMES